MDLNMLLRRATALFPEHLAVVEGDRRWTYDELGQRVDTLASVLAEIGIEAGDRAAIIAPNTHEFIEATFACAALGAITVPINHRLSGLEMGQVLTHSGARLALIHRSFAAAFGEAIAARGTEVEATLWIGGAPEEPPSARSLDYEDVLESARESSRSPAPILAPETVAQLYYTSGTTGAPKGVMLTHGNITVHALAAIAELHITDADTWLHAAPMFHLADAWATFAVTWVGGVHICLPTFTPEAALGAIEHHRVTLTNLVPTMLNLMVRSEAVARFDYQSLRLVLSGGAPIAPETVRRIVDCFGCDYVQTYGMTETSPYLTVSVLTARHKNEETAERQLARASRTGRPFLGVELKVVDEAGDEVAWDDQQVGEIVARGPTVTPGYWRDEAATAEAFTDGWLRTGDLAVVDSEGYLDIVDRKKDVIITGGENVYSTEVEAPLYEHPDVLEAAVVGVPHELWGEAVTAIVVPRPGAQLTAEALTDHLRGRLARYKLPKRFQFVEALPKTGSGKIAKRQLRRRLSEPV